jgi:hypothetical protein
MLTRSKHARFRRAKNTVAGVGIASSMALGVFAAEAGIANPAHAVTPAWHLCDGSTWTNRDGTTGVGPYPYSSWQRRGVPCPSPVAVRPPSVSVTVAPNLASSAAIQVVDDTTAQGARAVVPVGGSISYIDFYCPKANDPNLHVYYWSSTSRSAVGSYTLTCR